MIGGLLLVLGFFGTLFDCFLGDILPEEVDYWLGKVSVPLMGIGLLLSILGI